MLNVFLYSEFYCLAFSSRSFIADRSYEVSIFSWCMAAFLAKTRSMSHFDHRLNAIARVMAPKVFWSLWGRPFPPRRLAPPASWRSARMNAMLHGFQRISFERWRRFHGLPFAMANQDPNDVPSCVPLAEESQFGGAKDLWAIVLEIEMFRRLPIESHGHLPRWFQEETYSYDQAFRIRVQVLR